VGKPQGKKPFGRHRRRCRDIKKSVEITNKMRPCNRIYYSKIYWRLNMFRAAYRSSSGAPNYICSLWFIYPCGDRPLSRLGGNCFAFPTQPGKRPVTTCVYKPEDANTVWISWWWTACRSKQVEPSINFGAPDDERPLEVCWAFNKFWNNEFYYKVASCWLFLPIHTTMHGSMNINIENSYSINKLEGHGLDYWGSG